MAMADTLKQKIDEIASLKNQQGETVSRVREENKALAKEVETATALKASAEAEFLKSANSLRLEILDRDKELEEKEKTILELEALVKATLNEKEQAIANLTTENQKLESFLAEAAKNEIFLSEELQRFKYGISLADDEPLGEQLQLFPTPEELPPEEQAAVTPELETENTEPPAVEVDPEIVTSQQLTLDLESEAEPEPVPTEPETTEALQTEVRTLDDNGTLSRGELIEYIKQKYPDAKINPQNLTDAVNGKSKKMPEYESTYGFKYVGKSKGQHRFKLLNKG